MQGLRPLWRYFEFHGRSGRAEFWQWVAVSNIFGWILSAIAAAAWPYYGTSPHPMLMAYSAGVFIPNLAVGVRRLHDIGRSGRLFISFVITILPAAVLVIAGDAIQKAGGSDTVLGIGVVAMCLELIVGIYVFVLLAKAGDSGTNRYGPPDDGQDGSPWAPGHTSSARAVRTVTTPDSLDTIERLGRLKEQGLLSEEEFTEQKRRLLS